MCERVRVGVCAYMCLCIIMCMHVCICSSNVKKIKNVNKISASAVPQSVRNSYLTRDEGEGDDDHDHDEDLAEPDVGGDVPVAHGGESDDDEVQRFKHGEWRFRAASLYVLNAADSETLGKMKHGPIVTRSRH